MQQEQAKTYNPGEYESDIYHLWEQSGFFNPDNLPTQGDPYAIVMPPPNVTGVLHLGHAMENTLMDLQVRYQRMQGKKAVLIPGTDHAALATQNKVEKMLKEEGLTREQLGREKFLERTKKFAAESQSTILNQIRAMGTSADWSRLAYTFDDKRSQAVNEMFVRMYNDGLIYRGNRIVNWCPRCGSALSDEEVEYVERESKFYYLIYGPIIIATARPETKFLDKVIIVHPDDERYRKFVGKEFDVEWINGPIKARVIADPIAEMNVGSGAMTITPAHSFVDFDLAQKYGLEVVQIIGPDGKMTAAAGDMAGLPAEEARERVIKILQAKGLVDHIDEHYKHNLSVCSRCGTAIQPLISKQWFIDVTKTIPSKGKSLKDLMREAVTKGHRGSAEEKITILPERFEKSYLQWIDNLRPWCISRQIWWGHRIPVWYKEEVLATRDSGGSQVADSEIFVGAEAPREDAWKQDDDTLDTWFSSATWTFSTLGWPQQTKDLETYHPTQWIQMGYEILFFWMARMIMMSTYALDQIPFRQVYFHGILRDVNGKKFSKSLGNGIDPLEIIQQYGTDALRLSLLAGIAPGNDARFYPEKVQGYRNFINKLWNISRFILSGSETTGLVKIAPEVSALPDRWIVQRLQQATIRITELLDKQQYSLAAETLYEFTWTDLADWYLELAKVLNKQKPETKAERDQLLQYILQTVLKLWHPFAPFVTEVIWKNLDNKNLLMIAEWPRGGASDSRLGTRAEEEMTKLQEIISSLRNARAEHKVPPASITKVHYAGQTAIDEWQPLIESLARVSFVDSVEAKLELKGSWFRLVTDIVSAEKVIDQGELQQYITDLEAKLADQNFTGRAPQKVVDEVKKKLLEARAKLQ